MLTQRHTKSHAHKCTDKYKCRYKYTQTYFKVKIGKNHYFFLFLLKIGILHFCKSVRNEGRSPTSKYGF